MVPQIQHIKIYSSLFQVNVQLQIEHLRITNQFLQLSNNSSDVSIINVRCL